MIQQIFWTQEIKPCGQHRFIGFDEFCVYTFQRNLPYINAFFLLSNVVAAPLA